jgi:hypothetical protein
MPPFLEMADGTTPDVGLGYCLHLDGRLHAGEDPPLFQGILQGE